MQAMPMRDEDHLEALLVEPPSLEVVVVLFRHVYAHVLPLLTSFST